LRKEIQQELLEEAQLKLEEAEAIRSSNEQEQKEL
jgi:hypothetical protein